VLARSGLGGVKCLPACQLAFIKNLTRFENLAIGSTDV